MAAGKNLLGSSFALFLWLCVAGAFVFWRTFPLPYAFDDLSQLKALASMRSGQMSQLAFLVLPHNEHILPLVRVLFDCATRLGGLNAWPARAAALLIHVAGAFGCAKLARSITGDWRVAWFAGTIYVGAAGFSGSVVWEITCATFSIAAVSLIFALAVLTRRQLSRDRALQAALCLMLVSCLGMAGSVAALTAIPCYLFLTTQGRDRWKAVGLSLALQVFLLIIVMALMARSHVIPVSKILSANLLQGLWLILTAPYLFVRAWVPLLSRAIPFSILNIAIGSFVCWGALLYSSRWLIPPARLLLISIWAGVCAFMMLIGFGRSTDSLLELALTDRYYYFALLPLALHMGLLIGRAVHKISMRNRRSGWAVCSVAMAAIILALSVSRSQMEAAIPWSTFQSHSIALAKGEALARLLAARSQHASIRVMDAEIPFDGIHLGKLSLATLFFSQYPDGLPRVAWVFQDHALTTADEVAENQMLDGWSEAIGTPAGVCVAGGSTRGSFADTRVDFRAGAFDDAVIQGFQTWEHGFRWMTHSGTIRLTGGPGDVLQIIVYTPLNLLRKKWPALPGLRASVSINAIPIGEIFITSSDKEEFRLPLPAPVLADRAAGHPSNITLSTSTTWRGRDLGLIDERELSLAIISIGFLDHGREAASSATLPCSVRFARKN